MQSQPKRYNFKVKVKDCADFEESDEVSERRKLRWLVDFLGGNRRGQEPKPFVVRIALVRDARLDSLPAPGSERFDQQVSFLHHQKSERRARKSAGNLESLATVRWPPPFHARVFLRLRRRRRQQPGPVEAEKERANERFNSALFGLAEANICPPFDEFSHSLFIIVRRRRFGLNLATLERLAAETNSPRYELGRETNDWFDSSPFLSPAGRRRRRKKCASLRLEIPTSSE